MTRRNADKLEAVDRKASDEVGEIYDHRDFVQESLRRPESNDTLREQVATAQAESAALKGKAEALEAALDREVDDRRTLQQQIDHVRPGVPGRPGACRSSQG